TYLLINICYSAGLKNVPLLDVAILSAGFLMRVMFGAAVTGIIISNWLYLTIIAISFYFGLGKRRNELLKQKGDETRKVLQFYSANFLDKNMYVCLALGIVFYSLWCVDSVTVEKLGNIIWTIPCILLIFMKYSLTIERDSDGDPVEVLLHDKILLIMTAIFCVALALVIYVF
ncbi:MAG: prenyltransferase, partial [Clostridia bacterium]|nr:prenyltransferase [Clostridia bacterium]